MLWISLLAIAVVVVVVGAVEQSELDRWLKTPMPTKSLFVDFSAPTDVARWATAAKRAARGNQVLLQKASMQLRDFSAESVKDYGFDPELFSHFRAYYDVEIGYGGFRQIKSMLHRRYHVHGVSPVHATAAGKGGEGSGSGGSGGESHRGAHVHNPHGQKQTQGQGNAPHTPQAAHDGHEQHDWVASTFGHALHGDLTHIKHAMSYRDTTLTATAAAAVPGVHVGGKKAAPLASYPLLHMGSVITPVVSGVAIVMPDAKMVHSLGDRYNTSKGPHIQKWFTALKATDFEPFSPARLTDLYSKEGTTLGSPRKSVFPRPVVLVGAMNENWGWASTYYPNRTAAWAMRLRDDAHPVTSPFPQDEMAPILDDPNVEAIIVNGHTNISHPKVISFPLGIPPSSLGLIAHNRAVLEDPSSFAKTSVLFHASSTFGIRPTLTECILKRLHKPGQPSLVDVVPSGTKVSRGDFFYRLTRARLVLCLPGVGAETYRMWESVFAGAVAIVERGFGLERTVNRLPVLFVDDFADLSEQLLMQAYIQALYIADAPLPEDRFDFSSLALSHWTDLLTATRAEGLSAIEKAHPFRARAMVRPMVPFAPIKGGLRTPQSMCAVRIDPRTYSDEAFNGVTNMDLAP